MLRGRMGSVLMVARSELRRRVAGTLVATLLVAIVGTVALAALAGARRSDSALGRFNRWSRSSDIEFTANATPKQVRAVSRIPNVADAALVRTFGIQAYADQLPNIAIGAAVDTKLGTVVDRGRIIYGRATDPNAPDEIDIGESLARTLHL